MYTFCVKISQNHKQYILYILLDVHIQQFLNLRKFLFIPLCKTNKTIFYYVILEHDLSPVGVISISIGGHDNISHHSTLLNSIIKQGSVLWPSGRK